MSGLYYDLVAILTAAGVEVRENSTTDGWQTRARSSGGFPSPPLGVFWHHTASSTSPASDLSWMIDGSDDAPIGTVLVDRDGGVWPIAAGASNCAGKGGPVSLSRGTIPADSGNTRGFQIEVANNGVGEVWPAVQVDAFFAVSNALNAAAGNLPTDVVTHSLGEGDGWTDRKIDPATAGGVEGPWTPRSVTSSGTWSLADIRGECARRAGATPPRPDPLPDPPGDDDVKLYLVLDPTNGMDQYVTDMATFKTKVPSPGISAEGAQLFGWLGPNPGQGDPWGLGAGWAPFLDSLPTTSP